MSIDPSAQFVLDLLKEGQYRTENGNVVKIGALHAASLAGTFYLKTPLQAEALDGFPATTLTDQTTTEAMAEMCADNNWRQVLLLNFAAARTPGGGFLKGSKAQEEELCRCSGLYDCLTKHEVEAYYKDNLRSPDTLYTDAMIYSPGVVFFRLSADGPLLPSPVRCAVVTCPAPNLREADKMPKHVLDLVEPTFKRRWGKILDLAIERGHTRLLLGAWGCGAFRNDPKVVAEAFLSALLPRAGYFSEIRFAIPTRFSPQSKTNFDVLHDVLEILLGPPEELGFGPRLVRDNAPTNLPPGVSLRLSDEDMNFWDVLRNGLYIGNVWDSGEGWAASLAEDGRAGLKYKDLFEIGERPKTKEAAVQALLEKARK